MKMKITLENIEQALVDGICGIDYSMAEVMKMFQKFIDDSIKGESSTNFSIEDLNLLRNAAIALENATMVKVIK